MAKLEKFYTTDEGGIRFLWRRIVSELSSLSTQLTTWANSRFIQSINGKSGSSITIAKEDIGLNNVDNTADKDKIVAHSATSGNADTLDGKHAEDFLLKTKYEDFESVAATSLTDLDSRKADKSELIAIDDKKVDKEDGKGLSTNDYTNEEKTKLAGIEAGAQKNDPNTVIDANYVHTDNNYTTSEKNKLKGIEAGAQKNDPNTVIDADYVHTDNNYTDSEKSKLAGIEAGAQVNDPNTVVDASYVHTDNNYTTEEKEKLEGIEAGAQVNAPNTVVDANYVHTDNNYTDSEKSKLAGIEAGAQKNDPNTVVDASYVHTDNNYTTADKNKLAGIEAGAQKNTVTSVAGKIGDVVIDIDDVSGLQDALDGKQDTLPFTSTPSDSNKVVTQNELKSAVTGKSDYLGTIDSIASLSTTASKGDFYRVRTAWEGVHVGDMIIAEKDNPAAVIDEVNWSLMHNEMDTDTTYTFSGGTDSFSVTPSVGDKQTVSIAVNKVNGHTVYSDVPSDAKFTDTIIDNVAGDGIDVSGDHGENISLNSDTKTAIANAKSDHTKLGGHTIGKDVPADAIFTDTIIDNVAGDGISVSGTHGETISLDSATKTTLANAKTDHTNLGGHKVGKDVPSDAVFTDYQATKAGHYNPVDERTLSPDTSVLRDNTRDMAFVGAVHEDEKGHVVSVDTCAILAFTDAEIAAIIDQVTAEIAEEMA